MKTTKTFLRMIPGKFISFNDDGTARVTVLGDFRSTSGRVSFVTGQDKIFPAQDSNGNSVHDHWNVCVEGDEIAVASQDDCGNPVSETRTPGQLANAWAANQKGYSEKHGKRAWLNGISAKLIRESKVRMADDPKGRMMLSVSVPDPASLGKDGKTGFGSFLVSPDCVTACATSGEKRNVYLGRAEDPVSGYQIRTGEGEYAKVKMTAAAILANYEANVQAFGK